MEELAQPLPLWNRRKDLICCRSNYKWSNFHLIYCWSTSNWNNFNLLEPFQIQASSRRRGSNLCFFYLCLKTISYRKEYVCKEYDADKKWGLTPIGVYNVCDTTWHMTDLFLRPVMSQSTSLAIIVTDTTFSMNFGWEFVPDFTLCMQYLLGSYGHKLPFIEGKAQTICHIKGPVEGK